MKRIKALRSQLKKAGADRTEVRELNKLAKRFTATPTLSRSQKTQILQQIIPNQKYAVPYRTGFAAAGVMAVALALLVPNIVYSQPDDGILYSVKRGAETVRSVIQPGFEPSKPLPVNDNSRGHGSDDRLEEKADSDNSGSKSEDDSIDRSSNSSGSSGHSNGADDARSDDSSHGDNSGPGTDNSASSDSQPTTDHNAARDACKDSLDARKKNGEDIKSDQYKACDNL